MPPPSLGLEDGLLLLLPPPPRWPRFPNLDLAPSAAISPSHRQGRRAQDAQGRRGSVQGGRGGILAQGLADSGQVINPPGGARGARGEDTACLLRSSQRLVSQGSPVRVSVLRAATPRPAHPVRYTLTLQAPPTQCVTHSHSRPRPSSVLHTHLSVCRGEAEDTRRHSDSNDDSVFPLLS